MISRIRPAAIRGAAWCALGAAVAGLAWLEPGDAYAQSASTAAACTPLPPTEQYREVARKYAAEIETIEKSNGDKNRLLQLLDQLAFTYIDLNEFEQSVSVLEKALTVRDAMPGAAPKGLADNLVHLGIMQRAVARTAQAEATLARCLHVSEQHFGPDAPESAGCLAYLGALNSDAGRYGSAEPLLNRALGIYERHPAASLYPNLGNVLLLSGTHYLRLANYGLAEKFFRRNVEYREKTLGTCHPRFATSLDELAAVYHEMGRFDLALPLRRRAFDIMEKIRPPDHYSTAIGLSELGFTLVAVGDYRAAEPLLARGLDLTANVFGRQHWRTVRALWFRARSYEMDGRYAEMAALVQRGLHDSSATQTPEYLWRFQNAYSSIMRQRGQRSIAIYFGKQAVNTIQALRGNLTAFDRESQRLYLNDEKSAVYRGLADLMIEDGRLPEAQQVLAMLKEEEFFDFIRRDAKQDPRETQTALTGQEEAWQKRYQEVSGQLAALGAEQEELRKKARAGLSEAEKTRRTQVEADLRVARLAFDQFLGAIMKEVESGGAARAREVGERGLSNLRALQGTLGALGHGVVTLHYLMGDEKLRILLTTPSVQIAREAKIGAKDLNRKIEQFRRVLQNPRSNVLPIAQELHALLIGPVAEDLKQAGAQTLMISLDGALRYLPVAALHDGKAFVIETYGLALFTEAAKDKLKDIPQASWRLAGLGLTRQVEGFSALPAVRKELEGILRAGAKGVLPGEVHFDQEFTAVRLRDALDKAYPVLHVASHFVFQPGTESNSFLLLGDGNRLTLREMKENDLDFRNVDLITLSACETAVGGGKDANGQEIEGFGALAQKQGARGVIATLWPVADESTGLLMQNFYRLRESGKLTKAEALRQAQRALIGARNDPGAGRADAASVAAAATNYAHPYFWAPFILMGNWL